jgi:hypothetical protein
MTYSKLPEYMAVADVFVDYILQYCTVSFLTSLSPCEGKITLFLRKHLFNVLKYQYKLRI